MEMKTKNKWRQENILEYSKAFEDGDALQSKKWNTNTKMKNIATKQIAKHEAQTPKCEVIQKSEKCFNKMKTLEQKILQQRKNTKAKNTSIKQEH